MLVRVSGYFIFSLLSICFVNSTWAMDLPRGRVNMGGKIVKTACAIDTASRYQTIDMGVIPLNTVAQDDKGVEHPFSIRLVNCTISQGKDAWRHFQISFDGTRNNGSIDAGSFDIYGSAEGVSLRITDKKGNIIKPGSPLLGESIIPTAMSLDYTLRIVGSQRKLRVGKYNSTVKFKIDYY